MPRLTLRGLVPLFGLCWLGLTAGLVGKSIFIDAPSGGDGTEPDIVEVVDPLANLQTGSNPMTATAPVRSAVDQGMDALSAARRVEVVEDALLNGTLIRERERDGAPEGLVSFWRDATPYNVRVAFRRSDFRGAAPGVEGPFCGQRVNYDLALVEGTVSWARTESAVHPVAFLLSCARAGLSRNARHFEERPARAFLAGTWGMSFVCGGENYELQVKFYPTAPNDPASLGNVERLVIDRIEEPQWQGQMEARRDRDSGRIDITWSEDERGLHRSSRGYIFRAAAPDEGAGLLGGDVIVREGEAEGASCGRWSARKFPASVR